MNKKSPKHEGFTLLEVILSLAIIIVLIVGTYGLSITAIKNNKSSEMKQQASLYGQQIFEDFRSKDVIKNLTNDKSTLILSNGIQLKSTGDSSYEVSDYDLKNGYKADIKITKNSSNISSGQDIQGNVSPSDYGYTVNFEKNDLDYASMSDATASFGKVRINDADATEIDVYVDLDSDGNGKTIKGEVKGTDTNLAIPDYHFSFNSEQDKTKTVTLSINCSEYNLPKEEQEEDKGFEVHVYNHDEIPVNICLQKESTIYGTAIAEAGKCILYNNRPTGKIVSEGDLYDIDVSVTNNDGEPNNALFTSEISQNLIIN